MYTTPPPSPSPPPPTSKNTYHSPPATRQPPPTTQLRSDEAMYLIFTAAHPEIAKVCCLTTFKSLKPFYVVKPHKRSCECVYHTRMKMALEDNDAAHKLAHASCADPATRCNCAYCEGGACLKDNVYSSHEALAERVLCAKLEGEDDFQHKCIKGLCDECGWFECYDVVVNRKDAAKLKFTSFQDKDSTHLSFRVSEKMDGTVLSKCFPDVSVGDRPVSVRGEAGAEKAVRVTNVTQYLDQVKARKTDADDDATVSIRFETKAVREDRPGSAAEPGPLAFATCPRFGDTTRRVRRRYIGSMEVPRAKPKYEKNGGVVWTKSVSVNMEEERSMAELTDSLMLDSPPFFEHAWIAHHQARKFDETVDGCPFDAIVILLDFSMNYAHDHNDSTQSEWWSGHQSTLLPIVVYSRTPDGKVVRTRSHIYISPDPKHSNAFVQHALNEIIDEYKLEFTQEGRELKHVFVWSDGCAAQFKNKYQFFWLVDRKDNLRVSHSFFMSCHGKGPSDSEGAVVKSALRNGEFLYGEYFATTVEAFEYLVKHTALAETQVDDAAWRARKLRHTISRRTFHYVDYGVVSHDALPEPTEVKPIMSNFYFDGAKGPPRSASTLVYGVLTCTCAGCMAGDLDVPAD